MNVVLTSLKDVFWLLLLQQLLIFIYGLLGVQFFSGQYCCLQPLPSGAMPNRTAPECQPTACPGMPRQHFDHLLWAMLSVFQVPLVWADLDISADPILQAHPLAALPGAGVVSRARGLRRPEPPHAFVNPK